MSMLVLQPRISAFIAVKDVEVTDGVKVSGIEVAVPTIGVAVSNVDVAEGLVGAAVSVAERGVTSGVAVTGNGRMSGVGLI